MRCAITLISILALVGANGCSDSKKRRRAATIAKLAKTDCKVIAARARRCDSAVRKAADAKQLQTGKKHLAMISTLALTSFKDLSRCRKFVRQRVGFLKKDCKKYEGAADFCRLAQDRYLAGLKALNRCFASEDCKTIAECYVKSYEDITR